MQFVNPYFLFGLFALSIPIIVHLFNFRKYKVFYFSNTRFLQELQQRTNKKSQIRKLIILSLRMTAIAALVIAFARPYIQKDKSQTHTGNANVVIYVDNSFSMENSSVSGNLLNNAKEKAAAIADAYRESDRYMLITNDFDPKHQQFFTRDEFKQMLEQLEISSASQNIHTVYAYGISMINRQNANNKYFYFISDFQTSTSDFVSIRQDTSVSAFLIPLEANTVHNIYIDSLWLDSPAPKFGQQASIRAIIRNLSENDIEKLPVKLFINEQQRALASADVASNGYAEVQLNFNIDHQSIENGYVEILDNPIIFDDKMYFSLFATAQSRVLSLYDKAENRYLKALFEPDSSILYQNSSLKNINYASLKEQDLIIVELSQEELSSGLIQELVQYVKQGGSMLIIPSGESESAHNGLNNALGISAFVKFDTEKTMVSTLNLQHILYKNVFEKYPENITLPAVSRHFEISKDIVSHKEVLIGMENGNDFLSTYKVEKGNVYLLAVGLDEKFSDFPKQAIFVPTLYNMPLSGTLQHKLYHIIGKDNSIALHAIPASTQVPEIKSKYGDFIPEISRNIMGVQLHIHNRIKEAGNYMLYDKDSALTGLSFNHSRKESDMQFLSLEQLKENIATHHISSFSLMDIQHKSSAVIQSQINSLGTQLYYLFIAIALSALLTEVILLRLWK
ncbi:MAG: BatA and WFA domain-containing protein [Bacteroidales bacterium]|jgi:hypothetical protein|nr:BatA and WFA domain-containing protein [Bacteroidales bacterium]